MTWPEDYEIFVSLDEAAAKLAEPGWAILGGGSRLVAKKPPEIKGLIDLMPLGLDRIHESKNELRLEARVRLEQLVQRDEFDGLLKQAACSMAHSVNLRNQMTVAGETAWPIALSEWQTALLALDVVIDRHGLPPAPLADYLRADRREGVITALRIPRAAGWRYGFDRIAPADGARPLLVLAGAARLAGGKLADCRLVLGRLGTRPQRAEALEKRLRGSAPAALADVKLTDPDRRGLEIADEPGAAADTKWRWAESMIARFLAGLDEGKG